jgi:double-stranded uracil-DNA glycosylase
MSLPDIIAPGLNVIFCGINPGLKALEGGHHFIGRSNRFWRVLHLAGFTPRQLAPEEDKTILEFRCGLTSVVERATKSANELKRTEFITAEDKLRRKMRKYSPKFLAFLGKAAYAAMSKQESVPWGRQVETFGGVAVWVLPNPSGLNRSFSTASLVNSYTELRVASGAGGPRP